MTNSYSRRRRKTIIFMLTMLKTSPIWSTSPSGDFLRAHNGVDLHQPSGCSVCLFSLLWHFASGWSHHQKFFHNPLSSLGAWDPRKPPIISPMLLGEPKKYLSLARTYPTHRGGSHPKSDKTWHFIIISDHHKDWTDVDEGWFYGEWETGPWHGFHTKEKAFGAYGWVWQI